MGESNTIDTDDLFQLATNVESKIDKELNLTSFRFGSMLNGQGLLLTAYVFLAARHGNESFPSALFNSILLGVPLLALFVVFGAYASIIAATMVVIRLEAARREIDELLIGRVTRRHGITRFISLGNRRPGPFLRPTRVLGSAHLLLTPSLFVALWTYLLCIFMAGAFNGTLTPQATNPAPPAPSKIPATQPTTSPALKAVATRPATSPASPAAPRGDAHAPPTFAFYRAMRPLWNHPVRAALGCSGTAFAAGAVVIAFAARDPNAAKIPTGQDNQVASTSSSSTPTAPPSPPSPPSPPPTGS